MFMIRQSGRPIVRKLCLVKEEIIYGSVYLISNNVTNWPLEVKGGWKVISWEDIFTWRESLHLFFTKWNELPYSISSNFFGERATRWSFVNRTFLLCLLLTFFLCLTYYFTFKKSYKMPDHENKFLILWIPGYFNVNTINHHFIIGGTSINQWYVVFMSIE